MLYRIKGRLLPALSRDYIFWYIVSLSLLAILGLRIEILLTSICIPFLVSILPVSILLKTGSYLTWVHSLQPVAKRAVAGAASGLVTVGYLISIRGLINANWLSIDALLGLGLAAILSLTIGIIALHGVHIFMYSFQKNLLADRPIIERLIFYISSTIIVAVFVGTDPKIVAVIVICFLIYSLLIDLFIDQKKVNLIWLVVWTIILGSFLSMYIVYNYNEILISRDQSPIPILSAFTLFSVVFILSGFLYSIYGAINGKNSILPSEWDFNYGSRFHLRSRIQLSILLTLIFSFIAIGIVSVYHFKLLAPPDSPLDLSAGFAQALINTYVFLFLIGFAISFSLSQYIRTPLIALGKTLQDVKLHQNNTKIPWQGSDEIGNLISQYNQMIDQLEYNASQLAQIERDNAWREMAKQVAHEIKNPLTPMKLSLQHLQLTLDNEGEDRRIIRMCNTLMQQVDNLQQIANEFSNFGSLPKTDNQRVLLNDIVETIHDLFRNRQDMDIRLIEPIDDIDVYADKNQLLRVLNNLVKNSIQAIPDSKKGVIELKLYKRDNKAFISVKDNGIGIPLNEHKHIFKPRFTTKSSGSGLGLAIAANMLDTMGGKIHFISEPDQGTEFFVELPLIRSARHKEPERVLLYD